MKSRGASSHYGTVRAMAMAAAATLTVAACTTDDTPASPASVATTAPPSTEPNALPDGTLRIGLLLPVTDAVLGAPLVEAAQRAVDAINDTAAVLNGPVELIVADEGTGDATALPAIEQLLAEGVDAVVGPASSTVALSVLDELVEGGVLTCSPTASAIALDQFPDNGLFVRTIPSDSLQAVAIALSAERTGARDIAVAYVDDAYGRAYADAVRAALEPGFATITVEVGYSPVDDDLSDEAATMLDSGADAVIVLAVGTDAVRMIDALGSQNISGLNAIIANDTLRSPDVQGPLAALDADVRDLILGVAPPTFAAGADAGPYAANVTDCINVMALAAQRADSDAPTDIARLIPQVSRNGASCRTYERCRNLDAAGLQYDYDGVGGTLDISLGGEVDGASFERFQVDAEGRVTPAGLVTAANS